VTGQPSACQDGGARAFTRNSSISIAFPCSIAKIRISEVPGCGVGRCIIAAGGQLLKNILRSHAPCPEISAHYGVSFLWKR
jgi:hypothetical protein